MGVHKTASCFKQSDAKKGATWSRSECIPEHGSSRRTIWKSCTSDRGGSRQASKKSNFEKSATSSSHPPPRLDSPSPKRRSRALKFRQDASQAPRRSHAMAMKPTKRVETDSIRPRIRPKGPRLWHPHLAASPALDADEALRDATRLPGEGRHAVENAP